MTINVGHLFHLVSSFRYVVLVDADSVYPNEVTLGQMRNMRSPEEAVQVVANAKVAIVHFYPMEGWLIRTPFIRKGKVGIQDLAIEVACDQLESHDVHLRAGHTCPGCLRIQSAQRFPPRHDAQLTPFRDGHTL
jgi:hypothetical protein